MSIKVVLWDVDGTLLDFPAAERAAIRACFSIFGMGECSDAMLADYSLINRKYWEMLERGELSKPEVLEGRFREFFTRYGLDTSVVPAFNNEYQIRLGDTVCFHDNARETVEALEGKVLQYVVTNGTKVAQDRKLANSGLGARMDGVFISDVIGVEKPFPAFFDAVWQSIGHYEREEVLIVGDSLTSDMQGGVNAGILCCWYNPEGKENDKGLPLDYEIRDLAQVAAICGVK